MATKIPFTIKESNVNKHDRIRFIPSFCRAMVISDIDHTDGWYTYLGTSNNCARFANPRGYCFTTCINSECVEEIERTSEKLA